MIDLRLTAAHRSQRKLETMLLVIDYEESVNVCVHVCVSIELAVVIRTFQAE